MPAIDPNDLAPPKLKRIIRKVYLNQIKASNFHLGALDENWVDEYRVYYNTQWLTQYAIRLFYSKPKSNSIFGFVNVTPGRKLINFSEMYLPPPPHLSDEKGAFVTCILPYNKYGYGIKCVPFISPDKVISTCLHGAIWVLLQHFSTFSRRIVRGLTLPEIQKLSSGNYFCDGTGLLFPAIAERIIKMSKCGAFVLDSSSHIDRSKKEYTEKEMEGILYAYVESGLPVILGVDANKLEWWDKSTKSKSVRGHAIICIGHTMKKGKIDGYIFHDQSVLPYQTLSTKKLLKAWKVPRGEKYSLFGKHIMQAIVGVPPNVTVRYEIAQIAASMVVKILKPRKELKKIIGLRPILRSAARVEALLSNQKVLEKIKSMINIPLWNWVFLVIRSPEQRMAKTCSGFFIFDATTLIPHEIKKLSARIPVLPAVVALVFEKTVYLVDKERKLRKFVIEGEKLKEITK